MAEQLLNKLRQLVHAYWFRSPADEGFGDVATWCDHDRVSPILDAKLQRINGAGAVRSLATKGYFYDVDGPTLMDVLMVAYLHSHQGSSEGAEVPQKRWGPSAAECKDAGCLKQPVSTLLVPDERFVSAELMRAVHELFPSELRVRPTWRHSRRTRPPHRRVLLPRRHPRRVVRAR